MSEDRPLEGRTGLFLLDQEDPYDETAAAGGLDGPKWQPNKDAERAKRLQNRRARSSAGPLPANVLRFDRIDFRMRFLPVYEETRRYCEINHLCEKSPKGVPDFVRIFYRRFRKFSEEAQRNNAMTVRPHIQPSFFTWTAEPQVRSCTSKSRRSQLSQSVNPIHRARIQTNDLQILIPNVSGFRDRFSHEAIMNWSEEMKVAWRTRERKPLRYYYWFKDPQQKERQGTWSDMEQKQFRARLRQFEKSNLRLYGKKQWGFFSSKISTRCGEQCEKYYVFLVQNGTLHDPAYDYNAAGVFCRKIDYIDTKRVANRKYDVLSSWWRTPQAQDLARFVTSVLQGEGTTAEQQQHASLSSAPQRRPKRGTILKELADRIRHRTHVAIIDPPLVTTRLVQPEAAQLKAPARFIVREEASKSLSSVAATAPVSTASAAAPVSKTAAIDDPSETSTAVLRSEAKDLQESLRSLDGIAWQVNSQSKRHQRARNRELGIRVPEPPLPTVMQELRAHKYASDGSSDDDNDSNSSSSSQVEEAVEMPRRKIPLPRFIDSDQEDEHCGFQMIDTTRGGEYRQYTHVEEELNYDDALEPLESDELEQEPDNTSTDATGRAARPDLLHGSDSAVLASQNVVIDLVEDEDHPRALDQAARTSEDEIDSPEKRFTEPSHLIRLTQKEKEQLEEDVQQLEEEQNDLDGAYWNANADIDPNADPKYVPASERAATEKARKQRAFYLMQERREKLKTLSPTSGRSQRHAQSTVTDESSSDDEGSPEANATPVAHYSSPGQQRTSNTMFSPSARLLGAISPSPPRPKRPTSVFQSDGPPLSADSIANEKKKRKQQQLARDAEELEKEQSNLDGGYWNQDQLTLEDIDPNADPNLVPASQRALTKRAKKSQALARLQSEMKREPSSGADKRLERDGDHDDSGDNGADDSLSQDGLSTPRYNVSFYKPRSRASPNAARNQAQLMQSPQRVVHESRQNEHSSKIARELLPTPPPAAPRSASLSRYLVPRTLPATNTSSAPTTSVFASPVKAAAPIAASARSPKPFAQSTSSNAPLRDRNLPQFHPSAEAEININKPQQNLVRGLSNWPMTFECNFSSLANVRFHWYLELHIIDNAALPELVFGENVIARLTEGNGEDIPVLFEFLSRCHQREALSDSSYRPAAFTNSLNFLKRITLYFRGTRFDHSIVTRMHAYRAINEAIKIVSPTLLASLADNSWFAKLDICIRFYILEWIELVAPHPAPDGEAVSRSRWQEFIVETLHMLVKLSIQSPLQLNTTELSSPRQPLLALWRKLMAVLDADPYRVNSNMWTELNKVLLNIQLTKTGSIRSKEDRCEFSWQLIFLIVGLYKFHTDGHFANHNVSANWDFILAQLLPESPFCPQYVPTPHFWERLKCQLLGDPNQLEPELAKKHRSDYVLTLLNRLRALTQQCLPAAGGKLLELAWIYVREKRYHGEGSIFFPQWLPKLVDHNLTNTEIPPPRDYVDGVLQLIYFQLIQQERHLNAKKAAFSARNLMGFVGRELGKNEKKYVVKSTAETAHEHTLSLSALSNIHSVYLLLGRFSYACDSADAFSEYKAQNYVLQTIYDLLDLNSSYSDAKILTIISLLHGVRLQRIPLANALEMTSRDSKQYLGEPIRQLVADFVLYLKSLAAKQSSSSKQSSDFRDPRVAFKDISFDTHQSQLKKVVEAVTRIVIERGEQLNGARTVLGIFLPLLDPETPLDLCVPLLGLIDHVVKHIQAASPEDRSVLNPYLRKDIFNRLTALSYSARNAVAVQNSLLELLIYCTRTEKENTFFNTLRSPYAMPKCIERTFTLRDPKQHHLRSTIRTFPLRLWLRLHEENPHLPIVRGYGVQLLQIACAALFEDERSCWPLARQLLRVMDAYRMWPAEDPRTDPGLPTLRLMLDPDGDGNESPLLRNLLNEKDWLALLEGMLSRMAGDAAAAHRSSLRSILYWIAVVILQRLEELPENLPPPVDNLPLATRGAFRTRCYSFMELCFRSCPLLLFEPSEQGTTSQGDPGGLYRLFVDRFIGGSDASINDLKPMLSSLVQGLAQLDWRTQPSVHRPIVQLVACCINGNALNRSQHSVSTADNCLLALAQAWIAHPTANQWLRNRIHDLRVYLFGEILKQSLNLQRGYKSCSGACKLFRRMLRAISRRPVEFAGISALIAPMTGPILDRFEHLEIMDVYAVAILKEIITSLICWLETMQRAGVTPSASSELMLSTVLHFTTSNLITTARVPVTPEDTITIDALIGEADEDATRLAAATRASLPPISPADATKQMEENRGLIKNRIVDNWPNRELPREIAAEQRELVKTSYQLMHLAATVGGESGRDVVRLCFNRLLRFWNVMLKHPESTHFVSEYTQYKLALARAGPASYADVAVLSPMPLENHHPLKALMEPL